MKKAIMVYLTVFLLVLAGCQNQDQNLTEEAEIQEIPGEKEGVVFSSDQEEYETSAETLKFTATNEGDARVESDYGIFIEKNVDGTWYKVPYTQPSFPEPIRYLPPNESHTFEVFTGELENELTPGEYRAVHEEMAAPFTVVE